MVVHMISISDFNGLMHTNPNYFSSRCVIWLSMLERDIRISADDERGHDKM